MASAPSPAYCISMTPSPLVVLKPCDEDFQGARKLRLQVFQRVDGIKPAFRIYGNEFIILNVFEEMAEEFIPTDSEGSTLQVMGGSNYFGDPGDYNPLFVNYDIDRYSMDNYNAGEPQPLEMNIASPWDFRLQSGSPAIGSGRSNFYPVPVTFTLTGDAAPTIMQPSADLGAYPSNGGGLQLN